jgi:hypothetical protein
MGKTGIIRIPAWGWALAYLSGVGVALSIAFAHWHYDDPFITYRYAANLRAGLGLIYNPGERLLSTTTPLFALILALLGGLWPDLPRLANLIGAFSFALGGLFLWDLARTRKSPAVGWAGLLLYPTFPLLLSTTGSEVGFYLAMCLGAFALYARQRYGSAALLAGLAVLARSDAILVPLLLAGDYLLRHWKDFRRGAAIPWGPLALFVGLVLSWHAFAWGYYGAPLPVTLAAKQAQGRMAISTLFAPGFLRVAGWYARHWFAWIEAALALLGVAFAAVRGRHWLLFLAWPLLYFLAYCALGVSSYPWYYAPLVPGFIVAAGLGMEALQRYFSKVGAALATVMIAMITGLLWVAQIARLDALRQNPDARYAIYRAAGEWIAQNTSPETRVAALEVGIIGFYTQRPMIDFAGLIQPEVADQMGPAITYEDTAIWAVETYRPEVLALLDGMFPRLEQALAAQHCQQMQRFTGSEYGYPADFQVYVCRY